MKKPAVPLALVCLGLAMLPAAKAQTTKPVTIAFQEFKLKNGLRVILSEDHTAPTYSIAVTYNVGSRDEKPGRTGFAHLFEHMMFQGSENVGKGEHFILVFNNGGNMNGTTDADRTNYFQTLPANQLDLGLFLESDRMKSLVINQANLDNQRNAVQEEKRLGRDNQPFGKTFEALFATAYDDFAYKHETIGSMEDLNAATVDDVASFFKSYYVPNNAVLALVGDFKAGEALAKIRKYFERIPSRPAPPAPALSEPPQPAERRQTIEDAFAQIARLDIAYKIPSGNTPDFVAVDMLADILATGQSSRLYQKLVKEKQAAVAVQEISFGRRGTSLADFIILLRPGQDPAQVEKALYDEIERVKKDSVEDWELAKMKLLDRRLRVQELVRTLGRAIGIGSYASIYNDPNLINSLQQMYDRVTKADLERVARTNLNEANRTVILTQPKRVPQGGTPSSASALVPQGGTPQPSEVEELQR